ncbi:hypothetical protein ABZT43_41490, partial [Streptomyces sp. NPDC005349]
MTREPAAAEPGPGHGGNDDPARPGWVLGVDSGGSGLRVALASAGDLTRPETTLSREPVRTGAAGTTPEPAHQQARVRVRQRAHRRHQSLQPRQQREER